MADIKHVNGPKLTALRSALREIHELVEGANKAEDFHGRADKVARALSTGFDQYGNRQVSDDLLPVCRDINARIAVEVANELQGRRDQEIARIGQAIDTLRTSLPDLAAKACVELGAVARDMKAGA